MQTIAGSVTPFESTWAAGLSGKSLGPLKPWGLSLWKAKQGSNPEHQATVKELGKTSETHYPIRVELPMALTTDPSHPASLAWCLAFASLLRRLQKHSRCLGGEFTHGLLDPPEYQVIQVLFRPNLAVKAYTSSTAQGGGGSFKNRKPIGELGSCESGMAERSHWWTERYLRSPLFFSLSLTIYLPTSLSSMYLSICWSSYLSLSFSLSSHYLSTYLPIDLSTYLSIYLSTYLSIYPSIYLSLSLSFICLSV